VEQTIVRLACGWHVAAYRPIERQKEPGGASTAPPWLSALAYLKLEREPLFLVFLVNL